MLAELPLRDRAGLLLRRLAALVYDLMPVLALVLAVEALLVAARRGVPVPPGSLAHTLLLAAAIAAYFVLSWRQLGRTLGMRAWKLRVCRADTTALGTGRAALRTLPAFAWAAAVLYAWSLPAPSLAWALAVAGLGSLSWILIDRQGRSLQDLLTGSRIVRDPPPAKRDPS